MIQDLDTALLPGEEFRDEGEAVLDCYNIPSLQLGTFDLYLNDVSVYSRALGTGEPLFETLTAEDPEPAALVAILEGAEVEDIQGIIRIVKQN